MPLVRPRVSLLTTLLLVTIIAMAVALVRLVMEIEPLRQELEFLRAETGNVTVIDPAHMYMIGIETAEREYWRWRAYVSIGMRVFLHCQTDDVPKNGIPAQTSTRRQIEMPSGEWVYEFRIKKPDPTDHNLLLGYLRGRSEIGYVWQDITIRNRKTDWISSPYPNSKVRVEEGGRTGAKRILTQTSRCDVAPVRSSTQGDGA